MKTHRFFTPQEEEDYYSVPPQKEIKQKQVISSRLVATIGLCVAGALFIGWGAVAIWNNYFNR